MCELLVNGRAFFGNGFLGARDSRLIRRTSLLSAAMSRSRETLCSFSTASVAGTSEPVGRSA